MLSNTEDAIKRENLNIIHNGEKHFFTWQIKLLTVHHKVYFPQMTEFILARKNEQATPSLSETTTTTTATIIETIVCVITPPQGNSNC